MSARIPVLLKASPYEVIVGNGTLARAGEFVRQVSGASRCALVTDANVGPLYAENVRASLEEAGIATTVVPVPAGETSKSLSEVERICEIMIAAGLDRGAFVAALGGGVVGDLAGFVASIYYRGIPHVQIPTTVVAQVDSSIGGKTGVNARAGKNLIGAFHQPALVIADPETLGTLPRREFNEGLAEIIKHAIIRDAAMLDELSDLGEIDLPTLIARNVKIKARIVAEDEFEKLGLRALLNFGHTIGHAIENTAGYGRYLHGEAISLGLVAALSLSRRKAGLSAEEAARVIAILETLELPVVLPADLKTDALLAALRHDKKFASGAIRFVLTRKFGSAFVSEDVTESDLREAIEGLRGSEAGGS
jgi:3-dehydroquinate synthase